MKKQNDANQDRAETGFRIVRNRDNDDVMPLVMGDRFVIGYADNVNGRGAEEIDGFTPTRAELIQIVKYWYEVYLDNKFFFFAEGVASRATSSENHFAQLRIARAEQVLGRDDVDKAIAEAEAEFSQHINPEAWKVFRYGTEAEQEAFRDKFEQEVEVQQKVGARAAINPLLRAFTIDELRKSLDELAK